MNDHNKANDRVAAAHVDLVRHGDSAAQFYIDKPGLFGPLTAVDIYHCIADLASEVKELRDALTALQETPRG